MEALTRAVKSGKVRYIGFSEWSPQNIQDAIDMKGVEHFVSSQPQYSLLWRRPEQKVIPLCAANGISQIVWSPLAQGVLTGKYDPNKPAPAGTRAASDNMGGAIKGWMEKSWLEGVQRIKPLAAEAGLTMAQFALAWVLREPNVASAIVGASRPEQLDDNVKASGAKVDPALFAKAEKIAEESRPARAA
jgi:aryl-alcohol dehydrogenase-like predicted oxidoreductase